MTRESIANIIAQKNGVKKIQAEGMISCLFNIIKDELRNGNDVVMKGFGTFKVVRRAARKGRNMRTKEEVSIPEKNAVVFRPSKVISKSINM